MRTFVCVALLVACLFAVASADSAAQKEEFVSQIIREFKQKRKFNTRNLARASDHKSVYQHVPPKNADIVWSRHSDYGIYESSGIRYVW